LIRSLSSVCMFTANFAHVSSLQSSKGKAAAPAKVAAGAKFKAASAAAKRGTAGSATAAKPVKQDKSFVATHPHLFVSAPRKFTIGGNILPAKRDLSRFVRWPRYVRLQRQKAILKKRLKVPPALNQFTRALDKNGAASLFRLLAFYRPESEYEKKQRLLKAASVEAKGKAVADKGDKPYFVKFGLNHVTHLVETKKAKLVIIAHDVDPIELVVWLPALCRKMDIPYVIVKGKARLGHLIHQRTAAALAITEVRKEDAAKLEQLVQSARVQFNDDQTARKKWGGGIMGSKAQMQQRRREAALAKEASSKQ